MPDSTPRSLRHRLGLGSGSEDPSQTPDPADVSRAPGALRAPQRPMLEVEFAGYAEDCRIFGFLRYDAERLSDALNATESYELRSVLVAALADDRAHELPDLVVRREELIAVRATGLRGIQERRIRLRAAPVSVQGGPYTIHGYLHGPPGADSLAQLSRRKPMVPLTEAWIEYEAAGDTHRGRVGTIIVNRDSVDWIRRSSDEEVRLPNLPAEPDLNGRAKDLTGYIFSRD